jgi:CIC family chloride channel protein
MKRQLGWRDFIGRPGAVYARIRELTPAGVWEGVGIGLAAVAAAGAAMLFHGLTLWIEHHTLGRLEAMGSSAFVLGSLASVLVGSACASWLIARFAPSAGGGGVLPVKLAFWREFGVMRKREAAVKLVASAVTLGSGVSLGPEGPSIQIGAATLSSAAGATGVAKQARRAWCAAGAAAGLAAVFNAPLAAITFVLEEIIGDLHSRLIGLVVMAAVVGALVGHAVLGPQPAFQTPALGDMSWRPWLLVPLVALLAALGGAWFQRGAMALRSRLQRRPKGRGSAYRPMLGALGTWVIGAAVYLITGHIGIFGIGYGDITAAIAGGLTLTTAMLLFGGKIAASAAAVGTSGCGGIFAPSLFIGAMAGASIGGAAGTVLDLSRGEVAMLAMVGMAASLGAVIRTPLTCVLLMFEVTNQWVIVPALMLAALISQGVARWVNHHDLYEEILVQDGVDPNQVLPPRHYKRWREIPVGALASFHPVVAPSLGIAELRALLSASGHQRFPVAGADGRVIGVLARHEAESVVAAGVGTPRLEPPVWIGAKDTVGSAQRRLLESGLDFLCVGDAATAQLQGVLSLHDILRGQSVLEEDNA